MINQTPSHGINLRFARMGPDAGAGGGGGAAPPAAGNGNSTPEGQGGNGAAPPAPAPRIEKVKLTVNGKEIEKEVPYEQLVAAYQKRSAADEQFRNAAKTREDAIRIQQENEELRQLVMKDPIGAYKHLRQRMKDATSREEFDEVKYLTETLEARLNEAEQLKDPRERALAEERRRREELEAKIKKDDDDRTQRERTEKIAKRKEEFAQVFTKALQHVKAPQNPLVMESMARAFVAAKQHLPPGVTPTPEELAEVVKADIAEVVEKSAEGVEGEELLALYPNLTKRIFAALKARVQRKSGGEQGDPKPPLPGAPKPKAPTPPKPPEGNGNSRPRTPWDLKTI